MNMETGKIINSNDEGFQGMLNRGVLMPLDEAKKTTTKELKYKLSKNAAKRRRKLMRTK